MPLEEWVPTRTLKILQKRKNIESEYDFVMNIVPKKYYFFGNRKKVSAFQDKGKANLIVKIKDIRNYSNVLKIIVEDENKDKLTIVYFNQPFKIKIFEGKIGDSFFVSGTTQWNEFYQEWSIIEPRYLSFDVSKVPLFYPVYAKMQGISDTKMREIIKEGKEKIRWEQIDNHSFLPLQKMYEFIHFGQTLDVIKQGKEWWAKRIFWEQLETNAILRKTTKKAYTRYQMFNELIKELPFNLTKDQKEVTRQLIMKWKKGEVTSSLVMGDVGCGKTIVAVMSLLVAVENKEQGVFLAPTKILAEQHYKECKKYLEPLGVRLAFLHGDMKKREKKQYLTKIEEGEIDVIVGTHAVLSETISYKNIGMIIVDEEHRFGVEQRASLKKDYPSAHFLSMTATPIPRTLALGMYGDNYDVYRIETLPDGRKPVETFIVSNFDEVEEEIKGAISRKEQVYMICPFIEESENEKMKDIYSVEVSYEEWKKRLPTAKIAAINGKMKGEEVTTILSSFKEGKIDLIISTTMIEVGVNVPNATRIIILNAERFGLAQLHQLRGRVGRGILASSCYLYTEKQQKEKLSVLTKTNNGFIVAEEDLKLRGIGEWASTKQSGKTSFYELLITYPAWFEEMKTIQKNKKGGTKV